MTSARDSVRGMRSAGSPAYRGSLAIGHPSSGAIGGGGVSYDRRQNWNRSSPYSWRIALFSLPCSAP